jgi:hypothetical protein
MIVWSGLERVTVAERVSSPDAWYWHKQLSVVYCAALMIKRLIVAVVVAVAVAFGIEGLIYFQVFQEFQAGTEIFFNLRFISQNS